MRTIDLGNGNTMTLPEEYFTDPPNDIRKVTAGFMIDGKFVLASEIKKIDIMQNLEILLRYAMSFGYTCQVRYIDSEELAYTIPVQLNEDRIKKILNDSSIVDVRININLLEIIK